MRSGNPVLTADVFTDERDVAPAASNVMTLQGAVNKTAIVIAITIATAAFVWSQFFAKQPVIHWLVIGLLGSLISGLVIAFHHRSAPLMAPAYAACEGLFLGGFSAFLELRYPGVVIQAVAITFGTLIGLLAAYKSGLVKPTENLKLGIIAATGAIGLIYLANFVLMLLGTRIPYIHESGAIGIGFSLFVVGIAALNLVLDFDFIERGAEAEAPKYMEWYAAYALLVTLVWLYIEIVRLLIKLQDNRSRS